MFWIVTYADKAYKAWHFAGGTFTKSKDVWMCRFYTEIELVEGHWYLTQGSLKGNETEDGEEGPEKT